jgi:hypothetical protein
LHPQSIYFSSVLGKEFAPYASFHVSRDHSTVDSRSGNRANLASAVGPRQRLARIERFSRSERRAQEGEETRRNTHSQPNGHQLSL